MAENFQANLAPNFWHGPLTDTLDERACFSSLPRSPRPFERTSTHRLPRNPTSSRRLESDLNKVALRSKYLSQFVGCAWPLSGQDTVLSRDLRYLYYVSGIAIAICRLAGNV